MPRLLDLFCGRWGWSTVFAARGWDCVGVDLAVPPFTPGRCEFWQGDILNVDSGPGQFGIQTMHSDGLEWHSLGSFDFVVVSSPCEQFSVHGMKHFHPNPPYPEEGIRLFNHARSLCEASGLPYIMENVRAARNFVGIEVNHCGPFSLWGTAVPPLLPQGISKGKWKYGSRAGGNTSELFMGTKSVRKSVSATIPPELANCVADYAEALMRQSRHGNEAKTSHSLTENPRCAPHTSLDAE